LLTLCSICNQQVKSSSSGLDKLKEDVAALEEQLRHKRAEYEEAK
jgi:hypothetical protein